MTKRRNRKKSPNLPRATLDRAQKQAAGEEIEEADSHEEAEANVSKARTAKAPSDKPRRRRRTNPTPGQMDTARQKRKGVPDAKTVATMLANPTKVVTEEDLRHDYAYVLNDLRSMGLLSAALVIVLFVLSRFI